MLVWINSFVLLGKRERREERWEQFISKERLWFQFSFQCFPLYHSLQSIYCNTQDSLSCPCLKLRMDQIIGNNIAQQHNKSISWRISWYTREKKIWNLELRKSALFKNIVKQALWIFSFLIECTHKKRGGDRNKGYPSKPAFWPRCRLFNYNKSNVVKNLKTRDVYFDSYNIV